MANNQINFNINFKTNTSGLKQARDAMDQLLNISGKEVELFNPQAMGRGVQMIREAQTAANQLEMAMTSAYNVKLGTVNLERFNQELQNNGVTLQQLREKMIQVGPAGEQTFAKMASGLMSVKYETVQTTTLLDRLGQSLQRSIMTFASINIINKVKGSIGEAYGYVKNLDTSLNEIRIVTNKSADEMDRFAEKANKAAASLGKATTDYTKASTIFYQQGLSDQDVLARTETTMKVSNTTGADTKAVADNLTALWNGFNVGAEDAEKAVDVVAAVAAKTASNLDEMTTAMSKVASMANSMGVSEEQLAAQISTVIAVTRQAPESVGTAFKTIYARIADIKAGSEDAEISLGNYSGQLAALGINVLDTSGQLKEMGDIIEEVGSSWGNYSKEQQVAIAGIMGGQRQVNQLRALFDNWDKYTDTMKVAADAQGTLQQQQNTYMESAEGQLQKLRTEWEGILDSLLSSDDIIKVVKSVQPVLESIEKMIDAFGGGIGILQKFSPLLLQIVSPQIAQSIGKIANSFEAARTNTQLAKQQVEVWNNTLADTQFSNKYSQSIKQIQSDYIRLMNTMSAEERNSFEESMNRFVNVTGPQVEQALKEIEDEFQILQQQGLNTEFVGIKTEDDIQAVENQLRNLKDVVLNFPEIKFNFNNGSPKQGFFANEVIRQSEQELQKLEKIFGNDLPNSVQNFKNALQNAITSKTPENIRNLELAYQDLKNDGLRGSTEELEKFKQKIKDYIVSLQNAEQQQGKFNAKFKQLDTQQTIQSLTQVAQGVTSLISVFNQLKNIKDIWNNDDLTATEKVTQSLASLASIVTMAAFAYNSLANAQVKDTIVSTANLVVKKAQNLADAVKLKNIPAIIAALLGQTAATSAATGATAALATAETAADIAALPLIVAIGVLVLALALLAAAAYGVVKAVQFFIKEHETGADKLKKANKQLEEATEKYRQLNNAISDYKEAKKGLEELEEGTQAFTEAIIDLNEKVLKLIDTYPDLAQYMKVGEHGELTLNEEGLEKYIELQQKSLRLQQQQTSIEGLNTKQDKRNAEKQAMKANGGSFINSAFFNDLMMDKSRVTYDSNFGEEINEKQQNAAFMYEKLLEQQDKVDRNRIASYLKAYESFSDVSVNTAAAIAQDLQKEYKDDIEALKAAIADENAMIKKAEEYKKRAQKWENQGYNFSDVDIKNGDFSKVSFSDIQGIQNMSNKDISELIGVDENDTAAIQEFFTQLIDGYNKFQNLPKSIKWDDIDLGITEKFEKDVGIIENDILQNLSDGLSNLGSNINIDEFTDKLTQMDWSQGEDSIAEFNEYLKTVGLSYDNLDDSVKEYIQAQIKLNTVLDISKGQMSKLTTAMGQISTMKFGDMLSQKDYEELVGRFQGLEKYFQKVGEKYQYTAQSNTKVFEELQKVYKESREKLKDISEVTSKIDINFEFSDYSISGATQSVVKDAQQQLKTLDSRAIAEQMGMTEQAVIDLTDAVYLSEEQFNQLKTIIQQTSDDEAAAYALDMEFIYATIQSEEELNHAVEKYGVSSKAVEDSRAGIHQREIKRIEEERQKILELKKADEERVRARIDRERSQIDNQMSSATGKEWLKLYERKKQLAQEEAESLEKEKGYTEDLIKQHKLDLVERLKEKDVSDIQAQAISQAIAEGKDWTYIQKHILVMSKLEGDQLEVVRNWYEQINEEEEKRLDYENQIKDVLQEQTVTISSENSGIKESLAAQKNQVQRNRSKIEDKMSHASGEEYVALRQQKDSLKESEKSILSNEIQIANSKIKEIKESFDNATKNAILKYDENGIAILKEGIDLSDAMKQKVDDYNSAIQDRINAEYELEDLNQGQIIDIDKIADEKRKIANIQNKINKLEEQASFLTGDALLNNLKEQKKLREDNLALQRSMIQESQTELQNAQIALEDFVGKGNVNYDVFGGVVNSENLLSQYNDGTYDVEELQKLINNVNNAADSAYDLTESFISLDKATQDLIPKYDTDEQTEKELLESDNKKQQYIMRTADPNSSEYKAAYNQMQENNQKIINLLNSSIKDFKDKNLITEDEEGNVIETKLSKDLMQSAKYFGIDLETDKRTGLVKNSEEITKLADKYNKSVEEYNKLKPDEKTKYDKEKAQYEQFVNDLNDYQTTLSELLKLEDELDEKQNAQTPDWVNRQKEAVESYKSKIEDAEKSIETMNKELLTLSGDEYIQKLAERNEKQRELVQLYKDQNEALQNLYTTQAQEGEKFGFEVDDKEGKTIKTEKGKIDLQWSEETGGLLNEEEIKQAVGYYDNFGKTQRELFNSWLKNLKETKKEQASLNKQLKETNLPFKKFQEYEQGLRQLEEQELALKGAQQKLNAEMQKTSTQMSKLQDDASFLTGDDLVANLEAQISCMQQQQTLNAEKINQAKQEEEIAKERLELEKKKVEEAKEYLKTEAEALKQEITNLLSKQGISADSFFGKDGALDYNSLQKTIKASGIEISGLETLIKNYQAAFNDLNNAKKSSTQAEQAYANAINNTNQQLAEQDKLNNQILQKQQEIAKEKLKTAEAAIKRETSAQHGLSKELKDVEKTIKKIQKEQNELTGPALIAKIQEEIAAQEKKKQILEKQLRLMIEQLKAMAQLYSMHIQEQYGIGVGFQVDETGVSNLDELYSALEGVSSKLRKAATEDITNFISQLNSMASSVSSAQDAIDDLSDSIEDLQKKEKETAEDEAFRVKEEAWQREEIILKRINKELSHLQSLASHLWGTALINNLERQQSLLQQQAAAEQSKLSSMRQQLQVMAAMLAARGAMVSDGVVENYAEVYASGDQKLIQLISSYQSLYNSIIDLEQSIQDSSDKIFDIEFQKAAERLNMFKTKIDIELDLTKATRQWENFKREFLNTLNRLEDLNDSIYEKSKQAVKDIVSISNTDVGMLTSTVNTIINEINLMKGGGFSSLYGWDQKAAMDDLSNYRQQLQDALSEIHEKTKQVYDSYIEQMQKIANAFSEQQDSFSKIQSIIEHDMNLIKILKGAESYDALANYYDKSTRNYELQIQKLRDQVDFWKNIMDNAEVGSKKWEEAQKNWQAAIASLNSTVDAALENLVEKYDNLIKKVVNDFKKEMTSGEDLNWIKEKWDMQNKEADLYLDKISKEYNIQKLQYNYQKEIDKLNNPTQRQKLLKIMNEEVNKLKEKDKLTKYDVDRANKVYQLKMKQFEMENAQNNKTKMRLRRDAEGNYRYEYVADENKVQELKQDILDLEEEIRQFDISQIKTQKEKYIAEMEDFYNKMDELTKQKQDGLIDEAEWERRVEVLKNHFLEMTGGISDIIVTSKDNLIDSTTTEMLDLTMITEDALNEMSREAIETMVDEITPQYEDSVDRLTEKFSEYAEITESLVETLKDVFRDYDNEIQQIGLSAGVSFETVVAGIDQTIDETYNLIDAQDSLIDKYEQELDAIDRLISELQGLEDQYRAVYEAAMDAVNAALKMRMGDTSPDGGGSSGGGGLSGSGENNSGDTSKSPEDKKKERAAELLGMSGGDQVYVDTKSDEWYIFDTYSDGYNRYRLIHRKNSIFSTAFQEGFIFGGGTKQEMEKLLADVSKNGSAEAKKRGAIAKFDTGGYTGKWGTEGKIAMLHEKELILNQNDTANILDAVKYSRSTSNQNINVVSVLTSIERTVQGIYEAILNEASNALLSAAAASTSINNQSSNITNTINANFPNAGNMNEIQNALMNLPNYTSQKLYTNSRIK